MKYFTIGVVFFLLCEGGVLKAQNFDPTPISFTPNNVVEFKLNQPIVHLDVNNYNPSIRAIYDGQTVTFKFYTRQLEWTRPSDIFMSVRWDLDLDASNGIQWSAWETDQNLGHFATVTKSFSTPGKYALTFELKLYNILAQEYTRQKQYEIYVVPMPTAVYADQNNPSNKLFYWVGSDDIYDKPAFLVEGYDEFNITPPEINFSLGFDLIQEARNEGYDLFIMEWADGGADPRINKDVFLGATQFMHKLLLGREAAIQVVGISMGGLIARYGLAWAEDRSRFTHPGQYIDHYVNTFISFDSPQQGAHINNGLQNVIKQYGNAAQQFPLLTPAAQKMLYKNVFDTTNHLHDNFYDQLQQLNDMRPQGGDFTNGYPRQCINCAVSLGNRKTNYPSKTTNDLLAQVKIYYVVTLTDFFAIHEQSSIDIHVEDRDIFPGSTFTNDMTKLYVEGFKSILDIGFSPIAIRAAANWRFRVFFNPGYIPTESATDLYNYTRAADGSLIGGKSWFDDTLMQITFHRHDELTTESGLKVMQWLNDNLRRPYLGRPSSTTATAISYKHIAVSFTDEAAFEEGYRIERKSGNGQFTVVAVINPNSSEYRDYCVDPGTKYYYRVKAVNGSKSGEYSDTVFATTPTVGTLQAPTNLLAQGEPTYVSLTWNPVAGAAGYRIYRGISGQSCANYCIEVPSTSYVDSDLPASQQFSYQVTAVKGGTEGLSSNSVNAAALHMASNNPNAFSSNGQKKLVKTVTANGVPARLYMVYESDGGCYFTFYDEGSQSWEREHIVGNMPTTTILYHNPTLVLDSAGASVGIIYQKGVNGKQYIQYDIYNPWYNTIDQASTVDSFYALNNFEAMPVAGMTKSAAGKPSILGVLWRSNASLTFAIGALVTSQGGDYYQWSKTDLSSVLASSLASATHLTLSVKLAPVKNVYHFYLAWEDPGGVRCAHGIYSSSVWPPNASAVTWETDAGTKIFNIATNSGNQINVNPVSTLNGTGDVPIAWEYRDTTTNVRQGNIKIQVRAGTNLAVVQTPTYTFQNSAGSANYPYSPSLTDYQFTSSKGNDLVLVWFTPYGGTQCAQYINKLWSTPYVVDPAGRQAVLQTSMDPVEIDRLVAYTGAGGPPYTLMSMPVKSPPPPPAPVLSWTPVIINGVKRPFLKWAADKKGVSEFRVYRYTCWAGEGDCEANVGAEVIYVGKDTSCVDNAITVFTKSTRNPCPTHTVYYYVTACDYFNHCSQQSNKVTVNTNDNIVWKRGIVDTPDPGENRLEANYPNPFNPSTVINYQLSEPGFVSILVYDLLGQEVARLVETEQEAGYYTAVWDAVSSANNSGGGIATGMYYIQMTVNDNFGKQVFRAGRKVLYMK